MGLTRLAASDSTGSAIGKAQQNFRVARAIGGTPAREIASRELVQLIADPFRARIIRTLDQSSYSAAAPA
jgi:hypothetical protein